MFLKYIVILILFNFIDTKSENSSLTIIKNITIHKCIKYSTTSL